MILSSEKGVAVDIAPESISFIDMYKNDFVTIDQNALRIGIESGETFIIHEDMTDFRAIFAWLEESIPDIGRAAGRFWNVPAFDLAPTRIYTKEGGVDLTVEAQIKHLQYEKQLNLVLKLIIQPIFALLVLGFLAIVGLSCVPHTLQAEKPWIPTVAMCLAALGALCFFVDALRKWRSRNQ